MNEIEQLQEQLANITAERDALKLELDAIKHGSFNIEEYIQHLEEKRVRDEQAAQELESRFL
jgi:hypothetical protein